MQAGTYSFADYCAATRAAIDSYALEYPHRSHHVHPSSAKVTDCGHIAP